MLGREFNYELLHAAWGKGEQATLEMLDELLRHRLVEERAGPGDSDFAFTHHKIQEMVYQALPRHRCLRLHAQAGAALETVYTAEIENGPVNWPIISSRPASWINRYAAGQLSIY